MKNFMLIAVIGIYLSSCAENSSGSSKNRDRVTVVNEDNLATLSGHDHVVLIKAYDPTPSSELTEILHFGYIPKAKPTEVKLGELKNKVNIFHLFYRNKV